MTTARPAVAPYRDIRAVGRQTPYSWYVPN